MGVKGRSFLRQTQINELPFGFLVVIPGPESKGVWSTQPKENPIGIKLTH